MKIETLLEQQQGQDREYRRQKAEGYTKYLLNILKNDGFEELAYLELDHSIVSQSIKYINKFVQQYGETVNIAYFNTIFTPEFVAKIEDYNKHLV